MMHGFDAIILAGGRGSRLGGVDKASIELRGARLVDRTVSAALAAGATRTIVVGPAHTATRASHVVREDPPFTGPLPAIIAGLTHAVSARVMLLACDLVNPEPVCALLAQQDPFASDVTGVILRDDAGHPQWLASIHRNASLQETAREIGQSAVDQPLRRLFAGSSVQFVAANGHLSRDIDTPEDLAWARSRLE